MLSLARKWIFIISILQRTLWYYSTSESEVAGLGFEPRKADLNDLVLFKAPSLSPSPPSPPPSLLSLSLSETGFLCVVLAVLELTL